MSSYTAEMIHGLDRADSPIPSPPKPRWQVRYQDGSRERSAGIFNSPKAADTVRKRIDRAGRPWPTWRPSSANGAGPSVSRRKQVSRVSNGDRWMASIAAVAPCLGRSRSLIWGEGPYQDLAGALTRR